MALSDPIQTGQKKMSRIVSGLILSLLCLGVGCIKSTPFDGLLSGGSFNSHPTQAPPAGTVTLGAQLHAFPGQMVLTSDNGYLIGAYYSEMGGHKKPIRLIKTNSQGAILWTKSFDPFDDFGIACNAAVTSLCQISNGDILFTAVGIGYNVGRAFLFRLDANGNPQWSKAIDDPTAFSAAVSENGFVVTGAANISGNNPTASWIMAWGVGGDTVMARKSIDSTNTFAYGKIVAVDSFYVLVTFKDRVYTTGNNYDESSFKVYKIDKTGNIVWTKTIWSEAGLAGGGEGSNRIQSIKRIKTDGYIVDINSGSSYKIKIDGQGNAIWRINYSGEIIMDDLGGFWSLASSMQNGNTDVAFFKIDNGGNLLWNKQYGGSNNDDGMSMVKCADGNFVLASNTKSYTVVDSNFDDIWLLKVDSMGNRVSLY